MSELEYFLRDNTFDQNHERINPQSKTSNLLSENVGVLWDNKQFQPNCIMKYTEPLLKKEGYYYSELEREGVYKLFLNTKVYYNQCDFGELYKCSVHLTHVESGKQVEVNVSWTPQIKRPFPREWFMKTVSHLLLEEFYKTRLDKAVDFVKQVIEDIKRWVKNLWCNVKKAKVIQYNALRP